MKHEARRPQSLPQRLRDHDGGGEQVGIGIDEPPSVLHDDPVDRAERRVDDPRRDVGDALGELDRKLGGPAVRLVRELVALQHPVDMLLPRIGVDRLARLAEGGDRDGRLASAPAIVLLGEVLPLQVGDRHHGRERRHGDGDADEAQQHAQLVHAQLVPGLPGDADDGGGQ